MTAPQVDTRYYEEAAPRSLGERAMIAARDRIYADFLRLARPDADTCILDVGVSDVVTDSANMIERKWAHPERITALGLGEGGAFRAAFPSVDYRRIEPNAALPFADDSFDLAASNAVIEHVGSPENQAFFVAELARVARRVFVSAPNRWFPVEHHTAAPLAHFWRPSFELACRALGKADWLDPANLILIDRARLRQLGPATAQTGYTGIPLGPFSSNLYLYFERA
jgi:hypothetical protein